MSNSIFRFYILLLSVGCIFASDEASDESKKAETLTVTFASGHTRSIPYTDEAFWFMAPMVKLEYAGSVVTAPPGQCIHYVTRKSDGSFGFVVLKPLSPHSDAPRADQAK